MTIDFTRLCPFCNHFRNLESKRCNYCSSLNGKFKDRFDITGIPGLQPPNTEDALVVGKIVYEKTDRNSRGLKLGREVLKITFMNPDETIKLSNHIYSVEEFIEELRAFKERYNLE